MNRERIQLMVPMSGQGNRFRAAGFDVPKPLIPVSGEPMIERLLSHFPLDWDCHFILAENHRGTGLEELLRRLRNTAKIVYVPQHSKGPGHALKEGLKGVPLEAPVFVSYCDYGMVWDSHQFERLVESSACDACVVCYRGFHAHYLHCTRYAFCRLSETRVVEVREKGSFTDNPENEFASAGGYYFKSARLLGQALLRQSELNLTLNDELYTSLTVEALLRLNPNSHVRVFEIPGFFQWGTPEDLKRFEYWEKTLRAFNRFQNRRSNVSQVLMPMAGMGSRFAGITPTPKPLISVNEKPMFVAALESLPQGESTTLVVLESMKQSISAAITPIATHFVQTALVTLKETPSGQALSTEAGIMNLNPEREVLVSACDHGIVLDPDRWDAFHSDPQCDAAIFTVRGFPGCAKRPEAFAYVESEKSRESFPQVARVSVKRPLSNHSPSNHPLSNHSPSNHPMGDELLVGTFWFRTACILAGGIRELRRRDIRVNGELYLDSVFEILKSMGHCVRSIPLDGYINWGDPDSMAEAVYWQEMFSGVRAQKRPKLLEIAGLKQ